MELGVQEPFYRFCSVNVNLLGSIFKENPQTGIYIPYRRGLGLKGRLLFFFPFISKNECGIPVLPVYSFTFTFLDYLTVTPFNSIMVGHSKSR